jgi:hypothetical protein
MLVAVLLMGFLGANFSAIFSLMAASGRFRIPEASADFLVTMMRVSIGAISALAIYLLLSSELFGFIFAFEVTSSRAFLFIAFASGFSERLVKRALDTVVQAMGEGKKQAGEEQGESPKD